MMHHVVMHTMMPMVYAAGLGLGGNSFGTIRRRFRIRSRRFSLGG
ncbi:MAG TPA: hypothetical protein VN754_14510 [Candidatus Binataceae bacterium]|nr:hypothetical protein [Candidatus Binataceae bacterium]